jgi:hypothetical protein
MRITDTQLSIIESYLQFLRECYLSLSKRVDPSPGYLTVADKQDLRYIHEYAERLKIVCERVFDPLN